jgi:hypothetical protein
MGTRDSSQRPTAKAMRIGAAVLAFVAYSVIVEHSSGLTFFFVTMRADDPHFSPFAPGVLILFALTVAFCLGVFFRARLSSAAAMLAAAICIGEPAFFGAALSYSAAAVLAWLSSSQRRADSDSQPVANQGIERTPSTLD